MQCTTFVSFISIATITVDFVMQYFIPEKEKYKYVPALPQTQPPLRKKKRDNNNNNINNSNTMKFALGPNAGGLDTVGNSIVSMR